MRTTGENGSLKYDHELTRELKAMSYDLRETPKGGWELANISDETCQKFSKRRQAILAKTAELEKGGAKSGHDKLKDRVAHDDRIRKQAANTAEALREDWQAQMSPQELAIEKPNSPIGEKIGDLREALDWAERHIFERSATCRDTELLAQALRHARGSDFSLDQLKSEFGANTTILREVGGRRITTEKALETEKYILRTVKSGQGKFAPMGNAPAGASIEKLSPLQKAAAESLLSSRDFLSVFRGGAGTGKSTTLAPVRDCLEAAGKSVIVLAPQNEQVLGLRADGFRAQTLASFLSAPNELNEKSVLIVDEAGLVGGEDMAKLLAKAKTAGARIILSGDTRQKSSVAASDALRAIEVYASPHVAELSGEHAIHRQQIAEYRRAVACAESGDTGNSWKLLEGLGAIRDCTIATRAEDAAKLYVEKLGSGGSVLMLSQTNAEVESLNSAIRAELLKTGKLDPGTKMEKSVLRARDLTNAQKELEGSYGPESVVLVRNAKGVLAGKFLKKQGDKIVLEIGGKELEIAKKDMAKITICDERKLEMVAGDQIQLRANCKVGRKKLANGQILTVVGEDKTGRLVVEDANGMKHALPDGFRQFSYGYAVTSHAAQGKTVDHVIVSDSQCKAATNRKDFYVAISRGRQSCSILTSDRDLLKEHIAALGERDLASDLKLAPKAAQNAAVPPPAPSVEIDSPKGLLPLLGPSGAHERPVCTDERSGERVQLFGNLRGILAVRGLAKIADIAIRGHRIFAKIGRIVRAFEHALAGF